MKSHTPDTESQNKRIARHLKAGLSISPLRALELFGTMRLSARCYDLQRPPYNLRIQSDLITEVSYRFSRYKLIRNKKG